KQANRYSCSKVKTDTGSVIPTRVWIIDRWSPNPCWVVSRNIDHARVHGQNLDDRLTIVSGCDDLLLRSRSDLSILFGLATDALNRAHDVRLLSQECITEACRPSHVFIQTLEHIRKHHERLNTGIPVLSFCGLRQRGAGQARIALQPLVSLDDLQWICRSH